MAAIDLNVDDQTVSNADLIARMKLRRDGLLAESDWTQAADHSSPLADAKKAEWTTYRQSLRNLPATADISLWPDIWPTEPE